MFHVKHTPEAIIQAIRGIGLEMDVDAVWKSAKYLDLVLEWNQKTNLVSTNDQSRLLERHFIDSLEPIAIFGFDHGASVIDIGSGGGFPAIPISIARPDLQILATEAKTKKADILKQLKIDLTLKNLEVACLSVDNRGDIGKFDYGISRAVCELRDFVKISGPHLKPNGKLYTFKSPLTLPEEIRHFRSSSLNQRYEIGRQVEYSLPGMTQQFCLVEVLLIAK